MLDINILKTLLKEQDYTIENVRKSVINKINRKDNDDFFNIWSALSGDFSDSNALSIVESFIDNIIEDVVIPNLHEEDFECYDAIDIIMSVIEDNISEFKDLNDELSDYGDNQMFHWEETRRQEIYDYQHR